MSLSASAQLPIVKIAAGAVIALSVVGIGVMTGLIPAVSSKTEPPPAAAVEAVPPAKAAPSTGDRPKVLPAETAPAAPVRSAPVRQAKAPAAPVCASCGVINAMRTLETAGDATGAGAVAGAVAGLIVGNQIGDGRGRKLAKVAGAAGGAYAGHQIEKQVRKTTEYEISVRMEDGSYRQFVQATADGLYTGARVRVIDGVVVPD